MIYQSLSVFILLFSYMQCKSISDNNVTKSASYEQDLFPDWVPFKNKHGDQLGDFVPVEIKRPKKRLALPLNYMFRAFAEADPDDDFSGVDGDAQGGEEYEEKWTDTSGKTNVTNIQGALEILTKQTPKPPTVQESGVEKNKNVTKKEIRQSAEYSEDYEDSAEKTSTHADELRKQKILEGVDELKKMHTLEQKMLNENLKDEAMHTEERQRDIERAAGEVSDKYGKRKNRRFEYDDYDTKDIGEDSVYEKYKFERFSKTTTTKPPTTTSTTTKPRSSTVEHILPATGRVSVFRNPSLYMIYDDIDESTTITSTTPNATTTTTVPTTTVKNLTETKTTPRYSSKVTQSKRSESERISLVPQDDEVKGEPTLFFPKKRTPRRKNKQKLMALKLSDNYAYETVNDTSGSGSDFALAHTAPLDATATAEATVTAEATASAEAKDTAEVTAPEADNEAENKLKSILETVDEDLTAPSAVDAVPASSDHGDQKKDHDYEKERGGMKEHHSEHHSDHGESGKKGYSGDYKHSKTEKGHHDKEDHKGEYDDHGLHDERHHDEKKHYGGHHHEEHGKKHAEYEESGKHSKGHNTKGSHDVHKKEEYEKKVEFFEEEGDSIEEEKHGAHREDTGYKKGGNFKKGDHEARHGTSFKGDEGHHQEAFLNQVQKEYGSSAGKDHHGKREGGRTSKKFGEGGKKWIFHHGYPAKTADLVVIDRRRDQMHHGPVYYG